MFFIKLLLQHKTYTYRVLVKFDTNSGNANLF